MTRLFDEAVARARDLPEDAQDAAAEALFAHIANEARRYRLTPERRGPCPACVGAGIFAYMAAQNRRQPYGSWLVSDRQPSACASSR